ncbi:alpha/beta hydrolase [Oceanospirillum sp.]|uniref:alpha/beta hydrolase n=1 Tax=Oceanospirillum sp. TaxID=2021254 RepID=UPI003A90C9F3
MTLFTQGMKQVETSAEPDACVIWLHGLGAGADDFIPAVPYLKLPDSLGVRFLFPQAPDRPVSINGGWEMPAWYDILKMLPEREIDPAHLQEAALGLHELTRQQVDAGIAENRIFWIGFSQGGAVVLEAALNGGRYMTADHSVSQPAAIFALSTYQAQPVEQPHPKLGEMIFWHGHGSQDDVVPFSMGKKAAELTEQKAADSQWQPYPMAHEVCVAELEAIGHFIQHRLGQ